MLLAEDVAIRKSPAVAARYDRLLDQTRHALSRSDDPSSIVTASAAVGAIWRPLAVLRGDVDAAEHREAMLAAARAVLGLR